MRRTLILSAFVAVLGLVSLGCKSTHGRCDCNYDKANDQLSQPSNPYPTVGAPITGNTPAPMPMTKDK